MAARRDSLGRVSSRGLIRGALGLGLGLGASVLVPLAPAAVNTDPPARQSGPAVAYVTDTAQSPPSVWVTYDGSDNRRLGPGTDPLMSSSPQWVAASLIGSSGPALAIYDEGGVPLEYLNLASATATPLAWSRDLRYLAVSLQSNSLTNAAYGSGLVVIDLGLHTLTRIARGQIYGASFAPNGSDELVYARARSQLLTAPVNLYMSRPNGSEERAFTRDGRSLNPVWGRRGIAYDRERLRRNASPAYEIWLRSATGTGIRRLTDLRVSPVVSGLVPLAFSGDGSRLLAEFEGEDTSEAWTVVLPTGRTRRVTVRGRAVQGAGISGDGTSLLIDEGGFEEPPSHGRVATVPFFGGRSKVLVTHGSQAGWEGF
jgi:hypothetical protein